MTSDTSAIKCKTCGDPDIHFEKKFCSIECADIFDGIEADYQEVRIVDK